MLRNSGGEVLLFPARLFAAIRKSMFITRPFSMVINPGFIIRHGLFREIRGVAPTFMGDVLDFGCGSKPYQSLFVNAKSYIGVDLATSSHDHSNSQVDIYFDGSTLPFPDSSFDAAVTFEVFEHIFDPANSLLEIHRVLKPGGNLLITVPFAWDETEVPQDYARYTSFGVRHLLESNGFSVSEVRKTTSYFLATAQIMIHYVFLLSSKWKFLKVVTQLLVIFPMTLTATVLNALLPKRYSYFCNTVTLATKK